MQAGVDSDEDSDDYVRDEDDCSWTDEDYVSDWDEVGVRHKTVTTEIDELDRFALQMGCGDVLHVLQEPAHRLGATVDTLL